jgi:hypothetical protein
VHGAFLHRHAIPAREAVDTIMFQAYLTAEQAAQVRRRAVEPSTSGQLSLYIDSYFNSQLGSLHARHAIERDPGDFQIFNLQS